MIHRIEGFKVDPFQLVETDTEYRLTLDNAVNVKLRIPETPPVPHLIIDKQMYSVESVPHRNHDARNAAIAYYLASITHLLQANNDDPNGGVVLFDSRELPNGHKELEVLITNNNEPTKLIVTVDPDSYNNMVKNTEFRILTTSLKTSSLIGASKKLQIDTDADAE